LAVDATGNLFFTDSGNYRIRKVTPQGIITTVAGNGIRAYDGDGGAATLASLGEPTGVSVDRDGNIFIADYYNQVVRKVTPDGVIKTIAGRRFSAFGGDGGPAINAFLSYPFSVAVGTAGDLFISDSGNGRIRRVTSDGIINTVAGVGNSVLWPRGISVDAAGSVLFTDFDMIRKLDPAGTVTTVAGSNRSNRRSFSGDGGPARDAELGGPTGVVADEFGNLFIADSRNGRVREILGGVPFFAEGAPSGGVTLAGVSGGRASTSSLNISAFVTPAAHFPIPNMSYSVQSSSNSP
jgi:sugar lactone lactonase YvrE